MKKLIFTLFLFLGIFSTGWAQSSGGRIGPIPVQSEITFVPGLGESGLIWNTMSNELHNDGYDFTKNTIDYYGYNSISASANLVFIPQGDVVIAHSEGGLLAREYLRQNGTNKFRALITVGTPNKGAPIINAALNGRAISVLRGFVHQLLLGPTAVFDYFWPKLVGNLGPISADVLEKFINRLLDIGQTSLQNFLLSRYQNMPGINDMKPNSAFMNTLNQNLDNSLPSARYAIYGVEDFHTPWHLVGSLIAGPGNIEDPGGIKIHHKLQSAYGDAVATAQSIAGIYRFLKDRARANFNWQKYNDYLKKQHAWQGIASAFNVGYRSLAIGDQFMWSAYVTQSLQYTIRNRLLQLVGVAYSGDGLLSANTQAPDFFKKNDNVQRIVAALHANHLEETVHPSVKADLEQMFQNSDVNISKDQGSGGNGGGGNPPPSVSITGPISLASNQLGTWTAYTAGSVTTYKWYVQPVNVYTWFLKQSSNSNTFSHAFSNSTTENQHVGVKVKVTYDNGDQATGATTILLLHHDCSNSNVTGITGDSLTTHVIAPCPGSSGPLNQ